MAIRDNLTQWLEGTNDPAYIELAKVIKTGSPSQVKDALYNGPAKSVVETFANTTISYDFSFNGAETNKVDPTADITGLFHKGSTPTSILGGFDRTRQDVETFTVTDTFIDLLLNRPNLPCQPDNVVYEKNFSYPLTGNVNIGRFVNEFANLTLFDHLSGKDPKTKTYGATLTFTTTFSITGTPKLVLSPVGLGFHVLDAALGLTASRTDTHTLTLGFALAAPAAPPPPPAPAPAPGKSHLAKKAPLPAPAAPQVVVPVSPPYKGLFVNGGGTAAEDLATRVIDQSILRFQVGGNGNTLVVPTH